MRNFVQKNKLKMGSLVVRPFDNTLNLGIALGKMTN